jgi:hypothetical protein
MEDLAQRAASLPIKRQIELHFALAKAYEDVERRDDVFRHLLVGNALKRSQLAYDESAVLSGFDRIRSVFTPALMRSFDNVGAPSEAPVFIVGMLRSGSTLIEQILASHPQVFGAGELPNFCNAVAGFRPTPEGDFVFPEGTEKLSGENLQRLGARYISEVTALAPDATRITDKMLSNFLFVGLIHLAIPNARIIHAVRDPLDTCLSCFSKLFTTGQSHTYDLAELGRYYRGYRGVMEHWHRVLPQGRILDVHYEDVVGDLEGEARRIVAHCGLPWDPRCLAFHETKRPVLTASANQVRLPLYDSAIGHAQGYARFLGPLRAALGMDVQGA